MLFFISYNFWEGKNNQISRTTAIPWSKNEKYFDEFVEWKKNVYLCTAYEHWIELWCNGNTSDFGSEILGSKPDSSTQQTPHYAVWRLLYLLLRALLVSLEDAGSARGVIYTNSVAH